MSMTRVCIVSPGLLPVPAVRGGAIETLIMSLVRQNETSRRMDLTVVSIDDPEARREAARYRHTRFLFIAPASRWADRSYHYAQAVWKRVDRQSHVMASMYYRSALKAIRSERFDAVVFEGGESRGFTAYDRVFHGHLWYHVHAVPEHPTESAFFSHSFAISAFVAERWERYCSDRNQQVHVLYNCVDVDRFAAPQPADVTRAVRERYGVESDDFLVLYCGRVSPEKGVRELVRAVLRMPDGKVKLLVVGYPNSADAERYLADIHKDVVAAGGESRIRFTGYVPNEDLARYYHAADCQVVPSLWDEGAGNVCIEGMAAGLPIVATRSGGIPEYVSEDCAILLDRSADRLKEQLPAVLQALASDSGRCRSMGDAGIQRARRFSEEAYYGRYCDLIEEHAS